jgi:hypothetical protein
MEAALPSTTPELTDKLSVNSGVLVGISVIIIQLSG